jgi:Flp pilus assembly pilin Flp
MCARFLLTGCVMLLHPTFDSEAARRTPVAEPGTPSLAALARDERGAQLVEYIILVGMVAIVAMAGFKTFGFTLRAKIDQQAATVIDVPGQ